MKMRFRSRKALPLKMPMVCTVFILCMFAFPGFTNCPAANAAAASSVQNRSTYIWRTADAFKNEMTSLQFMKNHNVNTAFLQIDIDLSDSAYSKFIQDAGALGIQVYALGGAPNWVYPDQRYKMYDWIHWVAQYNSQATGSAQFKGMHLDMEPYTLPDFKTNTDTIIGYWKDAISDYVQTVHSNTPGMTASEDLPFWIGKYTTSDGQGGIITLSKWFIRELDRTTIMAYRNTSDGILSVSSNELKEAQELGKPALIAVETSDTSNPDISYYSIGEKQMMSDLQTVSNSLSSNSSYAGYAIDNLRSWEALKQ